MSETQLYCPNCGDKVVLFRDRPWHEPFLQSLEAGQSVETAAATAGVHATSAYQMRRRSPEFRQRWEQARQANTEQNVTAATWQCEACKELKTEGLDGQATVTVVGPLETTTRRICRHCEAKIRHWLESVTR